MATPSRFTSGVSTDTATGLFSQLPIPRPFKLHEFKDDFDNYDASEWVVTETGTGSQAVGDDQFGILTLTTGTTDDNNGFLQWEGEESSSATETFKFVSGKKLWFEARWCTEDADDTDVVIGLQITDTTPLATTDGVYFQSDDGDAALDVHVTKDSTSTSSTSIATLADATYVKTGFYYDGVSEVQVFVDDTKVATLATTNLPDDENLTVSFGVQTGSAAAHYMKVDYIGVWEERP